MSRRATHLKALKLALEDRQTFINAYAQMPEDPAAVRAAEFLDTIEATIENPPARIVASGFWHDALYYAIQAAETRIAAFEGADGLALEVRSLKAFIRKAGLIRKNEYRPSTWDLILEELENSPEAEWIHPLHVKPTPTEE